MKSKQCSSNSKGKRNGKKKTEATIKSDDVFMRRLNKAMTPRQLLRKGLIRIVLPLALAFGLSRYQNYHMPKDESISSNTDLQNKGEDEFESPVVEKTSPQPQSQEWKRYLTEDWMIAPEAAPESSTEQITHVETLPNGATCDEKSVWEEVNPQLFEGRPFRWYNELGQVVPSMKHLIVNATRLYKGPEQPGTHFVWPCTKEPRSVPGLPDNVKITSLSAPPRIFHVTNFLSDQEIEDLKEYAMSQDNPYRMARSTAGTHKSWEDRTAREDVLTTRTSENAFDVDTQNSLKIRQRAFQLLRLHSYVDNMADGIQILRYQPGQAYIAHHDYFGATQSDDHNWDPLKGGSNRWATVFLYLSDVRVGGQTVFPYVQAPEEQFKDYPYPKTLLLYMKNIGVSPTSWEGEMVLDKCFSNKLSVRPKKGDALLFYSQTPNGELDPFSLHGACPVLGEDDEKWGANLWVWNACRYSLCGNDPLQPIDELPPSLKAPYTS